MLMIDLETLEQRELVKGFHVRFIHSEHMTLAYWDIDEGAALPDHKHPQEQVANVLKGEFELTVEGVTKVIVPGQVVVIPGDVPHSGRALTPCTILDVFSPVREDYR